METMIGRFFLNNWQQKLVAILAAIIVWFFTSSTIVETKVIPSVPVRVVNLPPDYTILGLMPNGLLGKRITLTLSGTKDIIERLEPGDLEVVIDASIIDHSDWVMSLTKKNLVSLDPSIDLSQHIFSIKHSEYVVKLRKMMTEQIPITLLPPKGEPPQGYEFLDIWPQHLVQTFSGAEEEIQVLKMNGLELQFDLGRISKNDLDTLEDAKELQKMDELTYLIPASWKKLQIPCKPNISEDLNDPDANDLQIDFLRKQVLPISTAIPIRVFYPIEYSNIINPTTHPLQVNAQIEKVKGIHLFLPEVYVHDVTHEFLDTIRDSIEIVVTAAPKETRELLDWSVEIINPHELEDNYVETMFTNHPRTQDANPAVVRRRASMYRKRFREYMQKLQLYISPEQPLVLEAILNKDNISVLTPTP